MYFFAQINTGTFHTRVWSIEDPATRDSQSR